jgi:hypothetical protein
MKQTATENLYYHAGTHGCLRVDAREVGREFSGPDGEVYLVLVRDLRNMLSSGWSWFKTWGAAVAFADAAVKTIKQEG